MKHIFTIKCLKTDDREIVYEIMADETTELRWFEMGIEGLPLFLRDLSEKAAREAKHTEGH